MGQGSGAEVKRLVPLLLFVSLLPTFLRAQDGGYAGSELRTGLGARPVSMGETFTAIADDASAPFFNPAGAAWINQRLFAASYRFLEFDRRHGYLSLILPVRKEAALGLFWINSSVGDIVERDDIGQATGELKDHQNEIGVNFSKRFTRAFSAGANIKYLQKTVANVSAFSIAFDLGVQYRFKNLRLSEKMLPLKNLSLGLTAENVFARLPFNSNKYYGQFGSLGTSTTDTIPMNFRWGASYLFREQLLVSLEGEKNLKQKAFFHAGGEYTYRKILSLRTGFSHGKVSFGAGIRQPLDKKRAVRVDYAFLSSAISERGDHLFSLQFEF